MTVPEQKPGRSKQDYGTPRDFLDAVVDRFGPLDVDLAATEQNKKAPSRLGPEIDSLSVDWASTLGKCTCWLNPPFSNIGDWARKCELDSRRFITGRILLLTPASVGANWFAEYVHRKAFVLFLSPRLTFEGCSDPYPKDLMLSVFGAGLNGFDVWRWK